MRLEDNAEEAQFRHAVQQFIAAEAPRVDQGGGGDDIARAVQGFQASQGWFKKLAERGWVAPPGRRSTAAPA